MSAVTLEWTGDSRFEARSGEAVVCIDGDGAADLPPVGLLLASIGSCAAIDVVDILHKGRQEFRALRVEVEGRRRSDPPRSLTGLTLRFQVEGPVDEPRVQRAVDLSLEKYCSVFHSLRMDIGLDVEVTVRE
ncbi:MAG: OsmC family protein [Gemmatimonadota bacterium]|nr:OsmC family protein [Gemmatimonadota bacterium]